jgi:hypothetical protein
MAHGCGCGGGGCGSKVPVSTFTKAVGIGLVVVAVGAVAAALLGGCEKAPAPKGPAPVVAKPADPAAGVPKTQTDVSVRGDLPRDAGGWKVSGPDGDQTTIEVGGLTMPKPVTWVWTQPSMQFRALQYAVPANGVNAPAGELVFSVFKDGDGGPVDANLDRWANQFRAGAGAAESKRTTQTVNGMKVWRIESVGDYMGMGAPAPRPGQMQLGAIVEAPGRKVFMKLVGPQATVESNRAAFDAMVAGAK